MSEVRGLHVMGNYLYSVIGSSIYRTSLTGDSLIMNGTLLTTTGKVWMANNGTQLMIVDNPYGYILSGKTLALVSSGDFPAASSLTYQDGYFIISKGDSGQFWISGSYDGNSWDPLDFATAEGDPDKLIVIVSFNRQLWLFGKSTLEIWWNSGDAVFPFERIDGSFKRIGCLAPSSAVEYQGFMAWLDDNRIVRAAQGYEAVRISTDQIEYQFGTYTTISDAIGFIYFQEGHTFYILTFPTEGKTWVYDFSTQLWHTRASNNTDLRHRPNCCTIFEGIPIVGDYTNGKLYKYNLSKYSDDGLMLRRIRTVQAILKEKKNIFHDSLEIEFESGVGLSVNDPDLGTGTDPQAMLDWSDDGGHTWSNEHNTDIGVQGTYKTRAIWRRLGRSRDRIYRMKVTDPVKTIIIGAYLEATRGYS